MTIEIETKTPDRDYVAFTIVQIILFLSCSLESWIPLRNFETIRGSLISPYWPKSENLYTLHYQFFGVVFASKG